MLHAAVADKDELADVVFSIVYKEGATGYPCIKRFQIEGWIMNKDYQLLSEGSQVLWFTVAKAASITLRYVKKPRIKGLEGHFRLGDYDVKGIKANGVRLAAREVESAEGMDSPSPARRAKAPELFDAVPQKPSARKPAPVKKKK